MAEHLTIKTTDRGLLKPWVTSAEFTDWRMAFEALRLLEKQYQTLDEAHLD